ncbi:outer membrane lipoprotein-sorting protein [Sulfuriferula nivalis]|uniref:Membrane protein n=1 Tax=Sulfuriferula nivalis TaxID=2675298 RepID=A0A809SGV6_9PROT|nr:outer membrane lipoprotein-sorting protein [Sulfuriferula nivalis]BBP00260.1 membrane protein [Sulfuriferula nivalis]
MYKLLAILALVIPFSVHAQTTQEKGLAIAKEQDAKNSGFKDYSNDIVMTLKNAQGQETVNYLHSLTLEVPVTGEGDKSKLVFDKPIDVKGTAMLTFSHGLKPDDQWLFLPAVKRVKRLNSNNKSGPFMGSEFSYEDLSAPVVEKFTYNWLRDESCGDWQCHVVERVPAYEYSGYTRQVTWIDTKELRTVKIDYYERKGELLKTLTQSGFKLYKGKFWRAEIGKMVNHINGKSTVMASSNFQFGTGIPASEFEANSLQDSH